MSLFLASSSYSILPSVFGGGTFTTWDMSNSWNNASSDPTYSNVNLTVALPNGTFPSGSGMARSLASFNSGLRYAEITLNSLQSIRPSFGLVSAIKTSSTSVVAADTLYWWGGSGSNQGFWQNGVGANYGTTWSAGDVIGMLVDMNTNTITFYRNGVSQGTATSTLPAGSYHVLVRTEGSASNTLATVTANFGATPFAFPVAGATGIPGDNTISWLGRPGVADLGGGTMTLQGGLGAAAALPSLPAAGNWYYEIRQSSGTNPVIGLGTPAPNGSSYVGTYSRSGGYFLPGGDLYVTGGTLNTSGANFGGGSASTNPIGIAYTASTRTAQFYRNSTLVGSLTIGGTETLYPSVGHGASASPIGTFVLNTGGSAFTNPIPPGFTALNMRP